MNNMIYSNMSPTLCTAYISIILLTLFPFYSRAEVCVGGGENITTVHMAGEVFKIPKEYLSPRNDLANKVERKNIIEISMFFPDFSGFEKGGDIATVGAYNKKQITVFWTKSKEASHFDANRKLANALKYGVSQRDKKSDIEGLVAYKDIHGSGVTYKSQNTRGDAVLIYCSDGPVFSTCKMEYLDRISGRGIFASFDRSYLLEWINVSDRIICLIDRWVV